MEQYNRAYEIFKKLADAGVLSDQEIQELNVFFNHLDKPPSSEDFKKFISFFNQTTGKSFKGSNNARKLYNEATENFSADEIKQAVKSAANNKWFFDNPEHLNPDVILKDSNLDKLLNNGNTRNKQDHTAGQGAGPKETRDYYDFNPHTGTHTN